MGEKVVGSPVAVGQTRDFGGMVIAFQDFRGNFSPRRQGLVDTLSCQRRGQAGRISDQKYRAEAVPEIVATDRARLHGAHGGRNPSFGEKFPETVF